MLEKAVTVSNRLGLHARAAAKIVNSAKAFASTVALVKADGTRADAKSILDILALSATLGTELSIVAEGSDEHAAIDALNSLFADRFGEAS